MKTHDFSSESDSHYFSVRCGSQRRSLPEFSIARIKITHKHAKQINKVSGNKTALIHIYLLYVYIELKKMFLIHNVKVVKKLPGQMVREGLKRLCLAI